MSLVHAIRRYFAWRRGDVWWICPLCGHSVLPREVRHWYPIGIVDGEVVMQGVCPNCAAEANGDIMAPVGACLAKGERDA